MDAFVVPPSDGTTSSSSSTSTGSGDGEAGPFEDAIIPLKLGTPPASKLAGDMIRENCELRNHASRELQQAAAAGLSAGVGPRFDAQRFEGQRFDVQPMVYRKPPPGSSPGYPSSSGPVPISRGSFGGRASIPSSHQGGGSQPGSQTSAISIPATVASLQQSVGAAPSPPYSLGPHHNLGGSATYPVPAIIGANRNGAPGSVPITSNLGFSPNGNVSPRGSGGLILPTSSVQLGPTSQVGGPYWTDTVNDFSVNEMDASDAFSSFFPHSHIGSRFDPPRFGLWSSMSEDTKIDEIKALLEMDFRPRLDRMLSYLQAMAGGLSSSLGGTHNLGTNGSGTNPSGGGGAVGGNAVIGGNNVVAGNNYDDEMAISVTYLADPIPKTEIDGCCYNVYIMHDGPPYVLRCTQWRDKLLSSEILHLPVKRGQLVTGYVIDDYLHVLGRFTFITEQCESIDVKLENHVKLKISMEYFALFTNLGPTRLIPSLKPDKYCHVRHNFKTLTIYVCSIRGMKRVYRYRNLVVQVDNLFSTEPAEIYIKDTANRKKYACCTVGQNIMLNLIQTRPSINFKVLGDGEKLVAETDVITDELLLCQEDYLERRHDLFLATGEKWASLELVYLFDKPDSRFKPSISSSRQSPLKQVVYLTFIDLLANLKGYEVEALLGPHKVYLPKQMKTCLTYDILGQAVLTIQIVHPFITYIAQLPLSAHMTEFRGTIRCFAEANEYVDIELGISILDRLK